MNWQNDDFELFIRRILIALNYVKFWDKNSFTMSIKKILNIFFNISIVTLSFFLILSIAVDIKNSHDLSSFAKLDPLCFHLIGFSKWITGMLKIDDIEDLVLRMKRCHKLCLNYNENDTGIH